MIKLDKKFYGASLVALAFSLNVANVNAQTCTPAPTCETLGFTKSSADCDGKDALKCPFDQNKLFCPAGGGSGSETTQTYKAGDTYMKDGVIIGTVLSIDSSAKHGVVISSAPRKDTKTDAKAYCNNYTVGALTWYIPTISQLRKACNLKISSFSKTPAYWISDYGSISFTDACYDGVSRQESEISSGATLTYYCVASF